LQEVVRRITREAATPCARTPPIYLMTETTRRMLPYAAYHMPKEILDTIASPILLKHLGLRRMVGDVRTTGLQAPIFRQFPANR